MGSHVYCLVLPHVADFSDHICSQDQLAKPVLGYLVCFADCDDIRYANCLLPNIDQHIPSGIRSPGLRGSFGTFYNTRRFVHGPERLTVYVC